MDINITGLIIAIFVSLIFFVKFILASTGFDGDITETDGFEASDIISLKGFLNFMFGFSWYWACFGLNNYHWIGAIIVGFLCFFVLAYIYYQLSKLEVISQNEDVKNLLGRKGTVYTVFTYTAEKNKNIRFLCEVKYNDKISILEMYTTDKIHVGDTVIVDSIVDDIIYANKL